MTAFRAAEDEDARLSVVRSLELLDTPQEERFDRLARLAAGLLDVPVAFVSIMDSDRLWFKACIGLEGESLVRGESFCARTVLRAEPVVVPDLALDEEFRSSSHVIDGGLRFYAGMPLHVEGRVVGTLCVLDRTPRELSEAQLSWLRDLAAVAEDELGKVEVARALQRERLAAAELVALRRRDELILQYADSAIFGVDLDGLVTFANPAAERLLAAPGQVVGTHFHRTFHHTRADGRPFPWDECPTSHALRHAVSQRVPLDVVHRRDGTTVEVEYASAPVTVDGAVVGAVVTLSDISARRAVERMKDEFVSVVSHELRTPLTSIRGSLGLLASQRFGELPERAERLVQIALGNTERLIRLVNDILDLERINAGRVELALRTQPLAPVLRAARDAVAGTAEAAGVRVELEPTEVSAEFDHDLLVRAVTNLVGNAVKFSPQGEAVRVAVAHEGPDVVIRVVDRGRGIPADKVGRIFERFEQVDASDAREKGGTGLGLAITRSIAERHGGTVTVDSVEGAGSTFSLVLPARTVRGHAGAPDPSGRWVLVVEDDEDLAEVVVSALSAAFAEGGVAVGVAHGAREAVAAVQRLRPLALVLDVQLRDGDGYDVVERLRRDPATAALPVVVSSVHELDAAQRVRLTLGPTRVLVKAPSQGDAVHEVVEAVRSLLPAGSAG